MVTSKERHAATIALHQNGLTGKEISAKNIAPKITTYRIIKTFKERGSPAVKKALGCPRVNQLITSAALAQYCQQVGVSESASTVRWRLLDRGLVSRRAAKNSLLSKKTINDRLEFCRQYKDWTAEDWCTVVKPPSDCFEHLVNRLSGKEKVNTTLSPVWCQQWRIHVCGSFSSKGQGWAPSKLWPETLPGINIGIKTTKEQFVDYPCIFLPVWSTMP